MSEYPPYMNGYGYIGQVLEKIQSAPTPPKFTQDFLHAKLGITSSSARPIIPFLKRIGFISSDGTPTDRYKRFRNASQRGTAAAEGLREGYQQLYDSNEYVHELSNDDLSGLAVQVTGLEKGSPVLRAVVNSFEALKRFATFDGGEVVVEADTPKLPEPLVRDNLPSQHGSKFNLSYTINLNLPETSNPAVFDAIFKSLRENLLKQDA